MKKEPYRLALRGLFVLCVAVAITTLAAVGLDRPVLAVSSGICDMQSLTCSGGQPPKCYCAWDPNINQYDYFCGPPTGVPTPRKK